MLAESRSSATSTRCSSTRRNDHLIIRTRQILVANCVGSEAAVTEDLSRFGRKVPVYLELHAVSFGWQVDRAFADQFRCVCKRGIDVLWLRDG